MQRMTLFMTMMMLMLMASMAACGVSRADCSDEKIRSSYAICSHASDLSSCLAACGEWTQIGRAAVNSCLCSTLEEEQSCVSNNDCAASCVADDDNDECRSVTQGHCAASNDPSGCYCSVNASGAWSRVCFD